MAINSQYTEIWIGAYDLSGSNNGCDVAITAPTLDTTAFGDTGKTWILDTAEGTISHAGYFDTGTGTQESELYTGLSTATTIGAVFGSNQTLPIGYVLPSAYNRSMNITAATGSVIAASGEWGNVAILRGGVAYNGSISATGGGSSIDVASAGSAGGYAYVFVQSITGTATSATIDIESSANDSTWASEGTATFSAVGVQAVTMSGTVDRYLRINCTSLGGATAFTVGAIVCVSGVTY